MGFSFKKAWKAVTKPSRAIVREIGKQTYDINKNVVSGITGSDTLGKSFAGIGQMGYGAMDMTMGGGSAKLKEGFGNTIGVLGLGGEEEDVSALSTGTSDIEKKKKDLEDNMKQNTTGIRQQSVLTQR